MLDERLPERGGFGEDEAGVKGRVGVEGLPCGADDVAAALGKVGGYSRQEPCRLLLILGVLVGKRGLLVGKLGAWAG